MDGRRIAAVFAADAHLQVRPDRPAALGPDPHQFTHPLLVDGDEGVFGHDPLPVVGLDEGAGVVAGEPIDRLGQIVGAETEEFGRLGDFAGQQGSARQFDHGAGHVVERRPGRLGDLFGHPVDQFLQNVEFGAHRNQRDHDFRIHLLAGLGDLGLGLEYGAGLHFVDFRVGNAQPAAPVAEHGV